MIRSCQYHKCPCTSASHCRWSRSSLGSCRFDNAAYPGLRTQVAAKVLGCHQCSSGQASGARTPKSLSSSAGTWSFGCRSDPPQSCCTGDPSYSCNDHWTPATAQGPRPAPLARGPDSPRNPSCGGTLQPLCAGKVHFPHAGDPQSLLCPCASTNPPPHAEDGNPIQTHRCSERNWCHLGT